MAFGFTFAPTDANNTDRRNGSNPSQAPQGAIQTINYQLPRVAGAASLSPLVSQGGGGTPFSSAVLDSVLKTLLGADQASMMQGGGSIGGGQGGGQDNGAAFLQSLLGQGSGTRTMPQPNIIPGGDAVGDGLDGSRRQPSSVGPGADTGTPAGWLNNEQLLPTGEPPRQTDTPAGWLGNEQQMNAGVGGAIPNFAGQAVARGGGFGALMRNKEDGLSSPIFT